MLKKRILIYSPPPIGIVCYRGQQLSHGGLSLVSAVPFIIVSCTLFIYMYRMYCMLTYISAHIQTHTVYCTCLLTGHVLKGDLDTECNPMFYVNVNDIDTLHTTRHYVACEGGTAVLPLFLSLPLSLTH